MATQREVYRRVFITNTMTVHPRAHPPLTHEERTVQLSNLDRKCPLLVYSVFFYRSPAPHQRPQTLSDGHLVSSLKRGLEEALSDWYPAAGRLSLVPAAASCGRFNLACTNSGALLVEAVTPAKISELGDLSQCNDFYEHLVYRPPLAGCLSDMPLLVAQVTRFACGGYAIGVGTSHALFDGLAIYNFTSAWAYSTVGDAGKEVNLVKPVHERGRLLTGHGGNLDESEDAAHAAPDGAQILKNATALDHLHQLINQATCMEHGDVPCQKFTENCRAPEVGGAFGHENFVMRTFPVSKSMVARLISEASDGLGCSSSSTFEAIAAHLFKARTKALRIPKNRMVCLQFAVNIRKRMQPPLSDGFAGNAFVLSSISCTAAELEQMSLATIVDRIKKAKKAITEDYVMRYLEALDAPHRSLPPLPELTIVSDWTKTPYHNIDFGLGKPAYFVPLAAPMPQVAYFVQSPSEEGRIDVRIGLLEKHVAAFHHHFLDASN